MPNPIPPPDNTPPLSQPMPSSTPPPLVPPGGGGGGETMTEFMKLFTPEQRAKFMKILIQNLTQEMQKQSKKAIEALKKQREQTERET